MQDIILTMNQKPLDEVECFRILRCCLKEGLDLGLYVWLPSSDAKRHGECVVFVYIVCDLKGCIIYGVCDLLKYGLCT